jgi:hypothetical protein
MSAPSTVEADVPPLLSDGRGVAPPSPDCQQSRQPDAGRSKQVAEIAENAGIDENEVLEGSPLIGKSLAETAETPCKYFARETVVAPASISFVSWRRSGHGVSLHTVVADDLVP